jgi:hypothetical protein
MELKELLEDEIVTEIEKISSMEPGSDQHEKAVKSLTELYWLNMQETENERAFRETCERDVKDERDMQLRVEELKEKKLERYFRYGAEAAGLILPLVFYAFWMRKGFKFEETGTFTSTTFRGLFSKFRPKK